MRLTRSGLAILIVAVGCALLIGLIGDTLSGLVSPPERKG